jgi:hypothetical protein
VAEDHGAQLQQHAAPPPPQPAHTTWTELWNARSVRACAVD